MSIVLKVLDIVSVIYGLLALTITVAASIEGSEAMTHAAAFFGTTGGLAVICVLTLRFGLFQLRKDGEILARIALTLLLLGSSMMFMAPDSRFYRWGAFTFYIGVACTLGTLIDWGYERLQKTAAS